MKEESLGRNLAGRESDKKKEEGRRRFSWSTLPQGMAVAQKPGETAEMKSQTGGELTRVKVIYHSKEKGLERADARGAIVLTKWGKIREGKNWGKMKLNQAQIRRKIGKVTPGVSKTTMETEGEGPILGFGVAKYLAGSNGRIRSHSNGGKRGESQPLPGEAGLMSGPTARRRKQGNRTRRSGRGPGAQR